jgi:hypothetical protein
VPDDQSWLDPARLLLFAAFVLPGFIAWKVGQLRLPQGEQKPQDVILEILGYGVANALLANALRLSPVNWESLPSNAFENLKLAAAAFLLPAATSLAIGSTRDLMVKARFFVPGYPTAWDRLVLARLRKKPFLVAATLRDGRKIGGAFLSESFASNYPYEHDLLIDAVWTIDQVSGEFINRVQGEVGLYVRGKDIMTLEVFEEATISEQTGA